MAQLISFVTLRPLLGAQKHRHHKVGGRKREARAVIPCVRSGDRYFGVQLLLIVVVGPTVVHG